MLCPPVAAQAAGLWYCAAQSGSNTTPLIHWPGLEDLLFIQGNITEHPLNASPGEGFIHRCQLLLHFRHDVRCIFDSDPLTNHAGPKNRAVDTCSQVVLIPLHN